jgi:hypothetical protein
MKIGIKSDGKTFRKKALHKEANFTGRQSMDKGVV